MPATMTRRTKAKNRKKAKVATARWITDKEITTATKLAERKTGVTRQQLATALRITITRARVILNRHVKAKQTVLGTGKENRAVVYKIT